MRSLPSAGLTRRRLLAGAGAGLSATSAWWLAPLVRDGPLPDDRPAVVGHRGSEGLAPPNTMRAIRAALECGADGVEIDVRRADDGTLLLFHDPLLDWDSSGHGWIRNADWEQIEGARIDGEPLVTLADALAELAETDVGIFLEVKGRGYTDDVLEMADRYGVLDRVTILSFAAADLESARAAGVSTGLLGSAPTASLVDAAVRHEADAVLGHYAPRLAAGFVREAHDVGLDAGFWKLLDTRRTVHDALEADPEVLVTNRPDYALDALEG